MNRGDWIMDNEKFFFVLVVVLLTTLAVFPTQGCPAGGSEKGLDLRDDSFLQGISAAGWPTNQIIIRYQETMRASGWFTPDSHDQIQRLSDTAGLDLKYFREMSGAAHVLRLPGRLPVAQVHEICTKLMALPEVEYAEPDAMMLPTFTPNDSLYGQQWHYFAPSAGNFGINAPAAWEITTGSPSIVVAVIDTGITNHADLSGRTVPGYDFITSTAVSNDGDGRDADPSDPGDWVAAGACYSGSLARSSSWHGTHVAGTIGAASNNSLGVTGINWQSKILPVRVLGKCGGSTSDIADGIRWAAGLSVSGVPNNTNPAKVLSLSLGGSGSCSATMQNAIDAITAAGTVMVVAAGNNNTDASGFQPANCNSVITVAATDRNGNRASYSNYGATVEISAPGGDTSSANSNGVLSTLNTGTQGPVADTYVYYQGTSMATPHVSGVVSLMYSYRPSLTPTQIRQILLSSVTPFPAGSTCNTSICGRGILDARKAVTTLPIAYSHYVYLPLLSKAPTISSGFWASTTGDEFYVTTDGRYVDNFSVYFSVTGCGNYKVTHTTPVAISNNQFAFTGAFYASGTFTSSTTANGTDGLNQLEIPGCGIVSGGPWGWNAVWKDSSQPSQLLTREAQIVDQNNGVLDQNSKYYYVIKIGL
jgi:subtilisin family serine protease